MYSRESSGNVGVGKGGWWWGWDSFRSAQSGESVHDSEWVDGRTWQDAHDLRVGDAAKHPPRGREPSEPQRHGWVWPVASGGLWTPEGPKTPSAVPPQLVKVRVGAGAGGPLTWIASLFPLPPVPILAIFHGGFGRSEIYLARCMLRSRSKSSW